MRVSAVLLFLCVCAGSSLAQSMSVEIVNASVRSIVVERPVGQDQEYIDIGERKSVSVNTRQWFRLEMEALRYNFERLRPLLNRGPVVLELRNDDCLYFVTTASPTSETAQKRQPKGFPLCPTRRVDLV